MIDKLSILRIERREWLPTPVFLPGTYCYSLLHGKLFKYFADSKSYLHNNSSRIYVHLNIRKLMDREYTTVSKLEYLAKPYIYTSVYLSPKCPLVK